MTAKERTADSPANGGAAKAGAQRGDNDDAGAHLTPVSPEERAALLALEYAEAMEALEAEEPLAVAVATEYLLHYSEQVGELLKTGQDYLSLLTPSAAMPAIERIAMEVVLETVEEELDKEDV